jgi:hypothetical protein
MTALTAQQGQALLALHESDLATVASAQIGRYLTAMRIAAGNPIAQQAAVLQLLADAAAAGMTLGVEKQLAGMAVAGIQTWINAPPPATPAK